MMISNHEVPNEMIERYCRVIKRLEEQYNQGLEFSRGEIHNEIFKYVGCYRSLYRKEDHEFSIALNKIVRELT